jgi:putative transposase
MACPHCDSPETTRRSGTTSLGYIRFQCRGCGRRFNERTATLFNELQYPTDIVLNAVLWRLRYKLSLRDVAELLLLRGFAVTHETVRQWEARFAPLLADRLREKRRGRRSVSWYLDETYVKVAGQWRYLYRAIDRDGSLLDSMLSEQRDREAARRFLRQLLEVNGRRPLRVTTDRHPAYEKAIRWVLGRKAMHRQQQYLNNRVEQDHRGIKQRYYPTLGFGSFASAARFCPAFDALRDYFRARRRCGERVSLGAQREQFAQQWQALVAEMAAA